MKWTLIEVLWPTLSLAHLERSIFSLSRQTVMPDDIILFDNNSPYSESAIRDVISKHWDISLWNLYFCKHHHDNRKASWRNNTAIRLCETDVFVLARADFIYDFSFCQRCLEPMVNPMMFAAPYFLLLEDYVPGCGNTWTNPDAFETLNWRSNPARLSLLDEIGALHGRPDLDCGTFASSKQAVSRAGWYDESFTGGWGFEHNEFQGRMNRAGVNMTIIRDVLCFHMHHHGDRDVSSALKGWGDFCLTHTHE